MNPRPLAFSFIGVWALLLIPSFARAQAWTLTSAPSTNWTAIVCSADGTKVAAAVGGKYRAFPSPGLIYVSTNAGATWVPSSAPVTNWSVLASSADGSRLAAGAFVNGYFAPPVYLSMDSGLAWQPTTEFPTNHWIAMASSADGRTLMVSDPGGGHVPGAVFASTNSGGTWYHALWDFYTWSSVACSAGGRIMVAATDYYYEGFRRSADYGVTWTSTNRADSGGTDALALSADGSPVIAAHSAGGIFASTNFGDTWSALLITNIAWGSLACSARATTIIAAAGKPDGSAPGPVCFSTDSGASWTVANLSAADWAGVACSADGHRLFVADKRGGIQTLHINPHPVLNISLAGESLVISWLVPSSPFALEASPSVITPTWTTVDVAPLLNTETLCLETSLSHTQEVKFYRLRSLP